MSRNDDFEEELPEGVYEYCPECEEFFDDADFDFQICHICGWNGSVKEITDNLD